MGKLGRGKNPKKPQAKQNKITKPRNYSLDMVLFLQNSEEEEERLSMWNTLTLWLTGGPAPKIHPRCACDAFNAVFKALQGHCTVQAVMEYLGL